MSKTQQLIDQRAAAYATAQEYRAKAENGEELDAEGDAAWTRAMDDVDTLTGEIEKLERSAKLDDKFDAIDSRGAGNADGGDIPTAGTRSEDDDYSDAFGKWLARGMEGLDIDQRSMMHARAQNIASDAGGGFTVPEGFWAKITETMEAYGNVAGVAEVINTTTGNRLPWPTNDDTANEGEIVDENTDVGEQDLVFGDKVLGSHMYSTKMIKASLQYLQDTAVAGEAFIARKAGVRLGRITNRHLTVGTGTGQPLGIATGAVAGVTAAGADVITWEELVDLEHSVDAAYRDGGNVGYMLHDLTLAYIRKMKDGEGRPIWQPSLQAGAPSTLLGRSLTVNNHMATMATGEKSVLFGAFRDGYVVRNVSGGAFRRLDERYAEKLQVGFLGFSRHDGTVQDPSAYKALVQG